MEKVRQLLRQLKGSTQNDQSDQEVSSLINDFISNFEAELEEGCEDTSQPINESEYIYFLEILKLTVSNEELLNRIEPEKIRTTLEASSPPCTGHCPPPGCKRREVIDLFINSFAERLNARKQ